MISLKFAILHIQTVKKQDKSPRHSFDDVLTTLNVEL
jgi:hypothetical protein